jgi:hypothetical protein
VPAGGDPMIAVGIQAAVSRQYLLSYEKLTIAQHFQYAGMTYFQLLAQADHQPGARNFEEEGANVRQAHKRQLEAESDFEEEDAENDVAADLEEAGNSGMDDAKRSLLAAYELYSGIKRWLHVTIFTAGDVQDTYYTDKALQLQVAALQGALPPQITQLMYLKAFRTQLQTLSFAQRLQTISHFTMWLEDEIDVGKVIADPSNPYRTAVLQDQELDLITGQLYAFQAYNSFAQIELYMFFIDMYVNQIMVSLAVAQPAPAPAANGTFADASVLLETESTLEVEEKPFVGGAAAGGAGFGQFAMWISFYRVMLQAQTAQAGFTSAASSQLAYTKLHDSDESNDQEALQHRAFARQSFASFGSNLAQTAQIDQWLAFMSLYQIYGSMSQGGAAANAASASTASASQ